MPSLGRRYRRLKGFEPPQMKIDDDVRKSVVFLGHMADRGNTATFKAIATGFFIHYDNIRYLVTAAHVAAQFDCPFDVRTNDKHGSHAVITIDPGEDEQWFLHPDPSVDLAVLPFPYKYGFGMDHVSLADWLILTEERLAQHDIGVGDICYAVGLFRLLAGKGRNLPIVHRGSIAAMPSDELLPVENWRERGKRMLTRGYLVEATNLRGLSGAPVFVRPTISVSANRLNVKNKGKPDMGLSFDRPAALSAANADVYLLGIWSGSWEARADEVLSLDRGEEVRVPVGLGIVTPSDRLIEIIETPAFQACHERWNQRIWAAELAKLDKG